MPADPRPDLASAMWPALSREAKAREQAQAREEAWRKRNREILLRNLREANASLRADRERRSR
jgi:hypothetical protein